MKLIAKVYVKVILIYCSEKYSRKAEKTIGRFLTKTLLFFRIEHLPEDVLKSFPKNVFGKIMPKLVIISTPNSEYNQFFDNFSGMRHSDHKFEWSRQQFRDWAADILGTYPQYTVEYFDLGFLDDKDPERVCGGSTQIAVFSRIEQCQLICKNGAADTLHGPFEVIGSVEFPK